MTLEEFPSPLFYIYIYIYIYYLFDFISLHAYIEDNVHFKCGGKGLEKKNMFLFFVCCFLYMLLFCFCLVVCYLCLFFVFVSVCNFYFCCYFFFCICFVFPFYCFYIQKIKIL